MFAKFMNKKFFHPGSYPNEKQKWIKQQKHAANEKVEKEKQAVYQKEQESYQSRLLSAKTTEEKLKVDLNFMYDVPPGMRKNEEEDNDDKGEDKEKEVRFEWQKTAPRSKYVKDLGLDCQDQPFGVCVRNIRCFTCKAWGHQNTDRECPLYFANVNSEVNAKAKNTTEGEGASSSSGTKPTGLDKASLRLSDPLLLMNEMKEKHGLALKKSIIGKEVDPMVEMPDNEKILASDDEDTELGEADVRFVESLTNKQKRKLLKKLNKLEKGKKKHRVEGSEGRSKLRQDWDSDRGREKDRKGRRKERQKRKGSFNSGSDEEMDLEDLSKKHKKKRKPLQNRENSSDSEYEESYRKRRPARSDVVECEIYSKTGCCPLGRKCHDNHPPPEETSSTIMIKNFFQHLSLSRGRQRDSDFHDSYKMFYRCVYSELSSIGEISMFVCCCNDVSHLQGTVFVQFAHHKDATVAIDTLSRTYDRLDAELIPTLNWRSAICGLFAAGKCPDNEECNYLHIIASPSDREEVSHGSGRGREEVKSGSGRSREEGSSRSRRGREEGTCSGRGRDQEALGSGKGRDKVASCSSRDKEEVASSSVKTCGFTTTGICSMGDSCKSDHYVPEDSCTIILPNFFQHRKLNKDTRTLDDNMCHAYELFYNDFIEVFRSIGPVLMCKCSHNASQHLRGNFYVEYSEHRHALHAVNMFKTQDVAVELIPQLDWSGAVCGDIRDEERVCLKGEKCELLHVFENPYGEFRQYEPLTEDGGNTSRKEHSDGRIDERKERRKRRHSNSEYCS